MDELRSRMALQDDLLLMASTIAHQTRKDLQRGIQVDAFLRRDHVKMRSICK